MTQLQISEEERNELRNIFHGAVVDEARYVIHKGERKYFSGGSGGSIAFNNCTNWNGIWAGLVCAEEYEINGLLPEGATQAALDAALKQLRMDKDVNAAVQRLDETPLSNTIPFDD